MLSSLPRGIRNNNPGNLNFAHQKGAYLEGGAHPRFAVFPTPEAGLRALRDQLLRYYRRDRVNTIAGIIAKWAPPADGNETSTYAQFVASQLNLTPTEPLTHLEPDRLTALMHAIIHVENGHDPYGSRVSTIAHEQSSVAQSWT